MKDSGVAWIGQVPAGWEMRRNKYLFLEHKNIVGNESQNLQLLSLTTHGIVKKSAEDIGGKKPESYDTYQTVKAGQLVLCLFDLDCSAVFSGYCKYNGMISPAYKVFDGTDDIDLSYYSYWFEFVFVNRKYKQYSKNVRFSLGIDDFGALYSPRPPLAEQKQIAEFLDRECGKLDALVEKVKAQIAQLEACKKSIITEAVTKGVQGKRKMKDSGVAWIGQVPVEWEVGRVKDYYKFTTGFTPPSERDDLYPENGEVWITIEDLKSPIVKESAKHIDKEYAEKEGKGKVRKGSLLYSFKLSIGTTAIAGADVYTNEAIASFIPSDDISIDFLKYSCISIEHNANRNIYDAKILNQRLINNAKIVFPPLAEQKKIADWLDKKCGQVDEIIKQRKAQLEKLSAYKKSLIYEYVTGKKEVAA